MRLFTMAALVLLLLPVRAQAQCCIFEPDGLNMPGTYTASDFANPPGVAQITSVNDGGQLGLDGSLTTKTYKTGVILGGTDLEAGTHAWLFTSRGFGNYFLNKWANVNVAFNTLQTYTKEGGSDNSVEITAGRYYVVRFLDNGYADTQAIWSELTAAPVTFSSVNSAPSGANAIITANLSAAPSSEQIYVRYSTDNYATSTVVTASCGGTATCTATIPASASTSYYAFSSTASPSSNGSDADIKTINSSSSTALPVELTAFHATVDGATARLSWATASETNNAGFYVEQRTASGAWAERGFVAGHGTTVEQQRYAFAVPGLGAGVHRFRLRQVDLDGATQFSSVVEAVVGMAAAYGLDARGTGLHLSVRASQPVRAEAFDVAGRRVAVLLDAPLASGAVEMLALPATLPAGAYVVRVTGADFVAARVLVKTH